MLDFNITKKNKKSNRKKNNGYLYYIKMIYPFNQETTLSGKSIVRNIKKAIKKKDLDNETIKRINFETNGLGVLDEVISCFITEELNGDYELGT